MNRLNTTCFFIYIYQPLKPNDDLMSGRQVDEADINERICFVGVVKEVYSGTSKNGNDYLSVVIKDAEEGGAKPIGVPSPPPVESKPKEEVDLPF